MVSPDAWICMALKFLCDQMLIRLGKWLRAAGYDTHIAEGPHNDTLLLEAARRESRIFLTCDHRMIRERRLEDERVMALASSNPDLAAPELSRRLGVDWHYRPFTRCMADNALLQAAPAAARERIPPEARTLPGPVMICPACDRLYWPGSHVRRMRRKLDAWQGSQ